MGSAAHTISYFNGVHFLTSLFRHIHLVDELVIIFTITAAEEGILGASSWTNVWSSKDELDVLDYYEDFEVNRIY